MPDKGEEENDQQLSNQPCSVADINQADSNKLHHTKGVSWQDCVDGKSLFTVREFEPSETTYTEDEEEPWGKKKGCCLVM